MDVDQDCVDCNAFVLSALNHGLLLRYLVYEEGVSCGRGL